MVAIVGHPGDDGWVSAWPRRLSYGKELSDNGTCIHFDYDSLGGNSGSPVFGRDYKVKGIHTGAISGKKKKNKAQKVDNIKAWVNLR